jgi:hypothetical protein
LSRQDLKNTLAYIHSEINRIETMAGTLSMTEREHYRKLSNFDDRAIMDIAAEEQNAARQLGTMKEMCLAMAQKIEEIETAVEQETFSGGSDRA